MKSKKRLIVFQNPFSGDKKTRSVFNHEILPLLESANFELNIFGNLEIPFYFKTKIKLC